MSVQMDYRVNSVQYRYFGWGGGGSAFQRFWLYTNACKCIRTKQSVAMNKKEARQWHYTFFCHMGIDLGLMPTPNKLKTNWEHQYLMMGKFTLSLLPSVLTTLYAVVWVTLWYYMKGIYKLCVFLHTMRPVYTGIIVMQSNIFHLLTWLGMVWSYSIVVLL